MGGILNFISEHDESKSVLETRLYNGAKYSIFQSSAILDFLYHNIENEDISITYNYVAKPNASNIFLIECQRELRDIICEPDYIIELYTRYKDNLNVKFLVTSISEATPYIDLFENEFLSFCETNNINSNKFIFVDSNYKINDLKKIKHYFIPHFIYDGAWFLKTIIDSSDSHFNELNYKPSIPSEFETKNNVNRQYHIISLNRSNWKIHRTLLGCYFNQIKSDKLLWSFLNKPNQVHKTNSSGKMDYYQESTTYLRELFENNISELDSLWPKEIDTQLVDDKFSFRTSDTFNKKNSLTAYFDLVTESCFINDQIFFTEKIVKPITNLHPFIVVSTKGYLYNLKKLGFKTFDTIFDESYDDIEDNFERLEFIIRQVDSLLNKSTDEIQQMYNSVLDICLYNRNVLYTKYSKKNEHIYNLLKEVEIKW